MCVAGQGFEIGHSVETAARSENVTEGKCAQRGETASTSATDDESITIGVTAINKKARCSDGIVDINNPPLANKTSTIRTAVASGAAVVDIDNTEAA
ncbi:unannotated protein [freshwater metagenome]|uniref:Unannotated protein n=1 Tax=freshwater metagenome TaxID=449393 RepID=A0A6J6EZC7_9ZZZZ